MAEEKEKTEVPEPLDRTGAGESRFTGIHTRTYEAELLISGAVVYGLFQIAPSVPRFFEAVNWRLEGHQRLVAIYGQTYFSLVIYALIGAFLLHLTMRAFWIGLVGLESVYPEGVRWDSLKAGPFFIKHARKRLGSLAGTIDRLDDLCSLIFSFGFMIVVVFLYTVVLLLVSAAIGFLSSFVLGREQDPRVFWTVFVLLVGFQIVGAALDRALGPKINPDGLGARFIAKMIAIAWATSPVRFIGQIQLTLQSNTSNTRVTAVLMSVMLMLTFGLIGAMFVGEGIIRYDSLDFFPSNLREAGVDPRHYRALRPPNSRPSSYPSIQSDLIDGPYIKLTIPYIPRRHNPLIREHCPDLEAFKPPGLVFGHLDPPETAAAREAIVCLASLFPIEVDGSALADPVFDYTREPGSGREAIVTYIPAAEFETGRHEIVVSMPSRGMTKGDPKDEPTRHVIPFWR